MSTPHSAPGDLLDEAPARPRTPAARRRTGSVLAAVAATALWVLTMTRWADTAVPAVIVVPQALVPWIVLPAAVLLVLTAATRRWPSALATLALLLVHAALLAPWWLPDRGVAAAGGPALTVMSSNLQYGQGDAATIVAEVTARDVDVLVLMEHTAGARRALTRGGLDELLPHHVGRTREDAGGSMIYSRHSLDDRAVPPAPQLTTDTPVARVRAPGGDVLVVSVHPLPPWPGDTAQWHAEVETLGAWLSAHGDGPLVVAGDANGSTDHPVVRGLLATGMVDAHESAGAGRPLTWPHTRAPLPPLVHLDHVFTQGLQPVAAGSVRIPGSDHDAVWARLRRPAGRGGP